MTNSADPDQLASEEANRYGSTLFAKTGYDVISKRINPIYWNTYLFTTLVLKFEIVCLLPVDASKTLLYVW